MENKATNEIDWTQAHLVSMDWQPENKCTISVDSKTCFETTNPSYVQPTGGMHLVLQRRDETWPVESVDYKAVWDDEQNG